jgi:hypothetical protein
MFQTVRYSIDDIKEEARQLVQQGQVDRQQRIYTLCEFLPSGEWYCIECELERNDFLPRDRIIDLLGAEEWQED